jgi:hypothetical protein
VCSKCLNTNEGIAPKKVTNCTNVMKLTILGNIYSKLNGNGGTMLKEHNPHLGLPESRSIKDSRNRAGALVIVLIAAAIVAKLI